MIRIKFHRAFLVVFVMGFALACSNQKNTFMSRQYHALTTHYNVYFNGNESFKEGEKKIEKGIQENYSLLLPIFEYQNASARALSFSDMDRALEKAAKAIKIHSITRKPKRKKNNQSEDYKDFRKKKEYNNWIDDCYLLIGKAQFYKGENRIAEKAFQFILREYPDSELILEAKLWNARSLIDRGEFQAGEDILDRLSNESQLAKDFMSQIFCLKADLYIRQKKFGEAIPELERAISVTNEKNKKARYFYILAQLHQTEGNSNAASQAFQKLIDINPSYEMTFNAKISRALSYTIDEDGMEIRKELKKMLRDQKNKEYQDQIYYALAEMDVRDGNTEAAIPNYWKSTQVTVYNENQKAISFLKLGDYYFKDLNYPKAQMCYDSSMLYLGKEYPNYATISTRVGNLTELVNNLHMVEREDSLQKIAAMSSVEREDLISGIIKQLNEKEREQRNKDAEALSDRAFYSQNNMLGNSTSNKSSQGNWYFYNPTNIGLGKSDFQRKWGRRKLEDNWRRKNRSSFGIDEIDIALTKDTTGNSIPATVKKDPKSREYYLVDLPLDLQSMAKSNDRIMKGLYQASVIYEEKLNNPDKALETMEELLKRFPDNPYLLSAYYHCYSLYKTKGDVTRSSHYKNKILTEFKGSDYAKALNDPDYRSKIESEDLRANQMYAQAYEDFQNFFYFKVISTCNEGLLRYPESELRPRFLFLRALCIGRTQDVSQFKQSLKQVLESNTTSEIKQTTEAIISGLEKGAVPMQYSLQDMEEARQNRLLRNWRIEEEQALVKLEDSEKESTPIYQYSPEEEHFFVLMFPKKEGDPNRTLFNVSRYNSENYNSRVFKVDRLSLDEDRIMILVKGLKSKDDALDYFNGIITNEKAFVGLEEADYRNFVISTSNFSTLSEDKNIDHYLDFYTKAYFNIDRQANKTPVKRNGKLTSVNSDLDSTAFAQNFNENHKFVLLVPVRKTNIGKLRTDIYNHDKDYSVIKDQYDEDLDMIVVNNIGTKTEAMNYFQKLIKDETVYNQLVDVDYRNFIISEENFKKFYINKNLFPYLNFFKENYKIEEAESSVVLKQELIKDGSFTFNENSPHYFALIYPVENVDKKQLFNGIKKYNTRSLKLEVRNLDENREILLVSNLRNKKQAMMYFRAIVTNRELFAPIEKVAYRNFVISEENLNVFMEDGDPAVYLQFFKKYYLK